MPRDVLINLPAWLDIAVTCIWFSMAFLTGVLIHRVGHSFERYLRLAGWSVLATTWTTRLILFGDLHVSAPSILAVLLLAAAGAVGARNQLREWAADVRCYRDAKVHCHRADRIAEKLRRSDGK